MASKTPMSKVTDGIMAGVTAGPALAITLFYVLETAWGVPEPDPMVMAALASIFTSLIGAATSYFSPERRFAMVRMPSASLAGNKDSVRQLLGDA